MIQCERGDRESKWSYVNTGVNKTLNIGTGASVGAEVNIGINILTREFGAISGDIWRWYRRDRYTFQRK